MIFFFLDKSWVLVFNRCHSAFQRFSSALYNSTVTPSQRSVVARGCVGRWVAGCRVQHIKKKYILVMIWSFSSAISFCLWFLSSCVLYPVFICFPVLSDWWWVSPVFLCLCEKYLFYLQGCSGSYWTTECFCIPLQSFSVLVIKEYLDKIKEHTLKITTLLIYIIININLHKNVVSFFQMKPPLFLCLILICLSVFHIADTLQLKENWLEKWVVFWY